MRTYNNRDHLDNSRVTYPPERDYRKMSLREMMLLLRDLKAATKSTMRNHSTGPVVPTWPPGSGPQCGPSTQMCIDLVSGPTKMAQLAANRTGLYSVSVAALPAGNTTTATDITFVPQGNSIDVLPGLGTWRTVYISDLVSTLSNLDAFRVAVSVGGVQRFSYFGGRFSRGNANDCTTACGLFVCAGPMETITITVTNVSAAAFAASSTVTVETRVAYAGEEGFACEGSCEPPTGTTAQLPMVDCDCGGGEVE